MLGIWFIWHSHIVAKQGKMPWLNSSRKMWLFCFPAHIIILQMVVPFDSQYLTQTPLIESINLVYIPLGNCLSEPYRKMSGMQVLYSFSLVDMHACGKRVWCQHTLVELQIQLWTGTVSICCSPIWILSIYTVEWLYLEHSPFILLACNIAE